MQLADITSPSKRLLAPLLALAVVACTSTPDVDELGLAQPEVLEDIAVFSGDPDRPFEERGRVKGFVCYRSPFQLELKSQEAAIRDMRRQAIDRGGNAIARVNCTVREQRDWVRNCLATMTCTGVAVTVDQPQ